MKTNMSEEKGRKEGQNSSESPSLRRAIELISSLIFLSHSIKVFSVKWQSIRSKLEELNAGLGATENFDYGVNTALSGLIPTIMATLNECHDLARRCVDFSYSGKLLMQSDLDVISAKLDRHIKTLSGIVTSGILTNGNAIVVSKPGLGACRDDMRFYVRDLLTRLNIGDQEMKMQALLVLNEILCEDDKYVKIVVEIDGFISLLVNYLDSLEIEIQEESAKVVSVIAGFDSFKGVLIGSGIIAPLIRVLECGSEQGKEASARCLMKLTENSDNAWSVSAHGGVTALLKICTTDHYRGELIGLACGVLKNLVGVDEIKRFMVEEGAILTFVKLVQSKDEVSQLNSIDLLQTLSFGDESIRQMIIKEGGIRALNRVLDPKTYFSSKTREIALRAIDKLCFSSMSSVNILMSYGFIDQLMFFLRNGEVSVQEVALKAAFRLCSTSEEVKKAMGDAGLMSELVRFLLEAKSFEVREMAAQALHSMVLVHRNRRRFVQEDRNIGLLLQLLDPEDHHGNSGNRKLLLSTLMSLTNSNSGRKQIVNSSYLKNIEKLAEAQVSDAKRIVKKLSTNKFRSMLSGIWHS